MKKLLYVFFIFLCAIGSDFEGDLQDCFTAQIDIALGQKAGRGNTDIPVKTALHSFTKKNLKESLLQFLSCSCPSKQMYRTGMAFGSWTVCVIPGGYYCQGNRCMYTDTCYLGGGEWTNINILFTKGTYEVYGKCSLDTKWDSVS